MRALRLALAGLLALSAVAVVAGYTSGEVQSTANMALTASASSLLSVSDADIQIAVACERDDDGPHAAGALGVAQPQHYSAPSRVSKNALRLTNRTTRTLAVEVRAVNDPDHVVQTSVWTDTLRPGESANVRLSFAVKSGMHQVGYRVLGSGGNLDARIDVAGRVGISVDDCHGGGHGGGGCSDGDRHLTGSGHDDCDDDDHGGDGGGCADRHTSSTGHDGCDDDDDRGDHGGDDGHGGGNGNGDDGHRTSVSFELHGGSGSDGTATGDIRGWIDSQRAAVPQGMGEGGR